MRTLASNARIRGIEVQVLPVELDRALHVAHLGVDVRQGVQGIYLGRVLLDHDREVVRSLRPTLQSHVHAPAQVMPGGALGIRAQRLVAVAKSVVILLGREVVLAE
jgi:hypothetical protein